MQRPKLEVSDIFKSLGEDFSARVSVDQRRVLDAIVNCRTAKLGAHLSHCTSCDYEKLSYNSCRNRHCPKCQGGVAAAWVDARAAELLPVEYAHTVFTFPKELRQVAYQNKRVVYELFFRCVAETLHCVAANEKFLGAKLSFFSVLHTWNQKLEYFPHIHVVSPKGGLSLDGSRWVSAPHNFFLPVRALSKVFRGKMIDALRQAHRTGKLNFFGTAAPLSRITEFEKLLASLRRCDWVVYSKKPFGGPTQVLKYLSAYIHRVAISNHRLRELKDGKVTFVYRDSRDNHKRKRLTLPAETFARRFLLHLIPKNFTRIRHYGLFSTATKKRQLPRIRALLGQCPPAAPTTVQRVSCNTCPKCRLGTLRSLIVPMIPHRAGNLTRKPPTFALNLSPPADIIPQFG